MVRRSDMRVLYPAHRDDGLYLLGRQGEDVEEKRVACRARLPFLRRRHSFLGFGHLRGLRAACQEQETESESIRPVHGFSSGQDLIRLALAKAREIGPPALPPVMGGSFSSLF